MFVGCHGEQLASFLCLKDRQESIIFMNFSNDFATISHLLQAWTLFKMPDPSGTK
jgi:hypothetical protein